MFLWVPIVNMSCYQLLIYLRYNSGKNNKNNMNNKNNDDNNYNNNNINNNNKNNNIKNNNNNKNNNYIVCIYIYITNIIIYASLGIIGLRDGGQSCG